MAGSNTTSAKGLASNLPRDAAAPLIGILTENTRPWSSGLRRCVRITSAGHEESERLTQR